jgi:hypothetical protein
MAMASLYFWAWYNWPIFSRLVSGLAGFLGAPLNSFFRALACLAISLMPCFWANVAAFSAQVSAFSFWLLAP